MGLTVVFGFTETTATGSTIRTGTTARLLLRIGVLGSEITLAIYFTTADPYLYSDNTDFGVSLNESIVNVGTEGVEGSAAFLEHFRASHFSAVETTGDLDLDTFGTGTHGGCNSHLYSATIGDFTLDLTGDVGGYDLSVEFGTLYLVDVDLHILVGNLLELFLQFVHFLTALTDDKTGT